jgi:hypothetical protein
MGNGVQQTNCGLAWRLQWGSNRYAGNIAKWIVIFSRNVYVKVLGFQQRSH